jgi:hypothetical protein
MKIGIITLWGCANYGQNLQAYALQRFLRNAGHDVFLIRYPLIEYYDENPYILLNTFLKRIIPARLLYILYKLKGKKVNMEDLKKYQMDIKKINTAPYAFYRDPSYLIHLRGINQFINKYINQSELFYSSISELKEFPPDADVYITGSDQVWNFWGKPLAVAKYETSDAFFLNFGKSEVKRIAYAASFGTRVMDRESADIIKPLMKQFSFVSVREETGLSLCETCGYNDAQWVVDPTLLLDKEHYRSLYKEAHISVPDKPYCAVYMIRDNTEFLDKLYSWANNKNFDVVLISNSGLIQRKYKETFATIQEWLCLFDNAEYIITDSYHGSIFSIIFEKSFGIIPFRDCKKDIRLNDLFKRFKLRFPLLDDDNFVNFISFEEIKNISVSLSEIYEKYSKDWFNRIIS